MIRRGVVMRRGKSGGNNEQYEREWRCREDSDATVGDEKE